MMYVVSVSLYFDDLVLKINPSNCKRNILHLIWIVEQDRHTARIFEAKGGFCKLGQILISSIKLNYMETIQHASFKNSYFYPIQIMLANKGNPQRLQHFYKEKLSFSSYTIYSTFNFQRPSNGMMNLNIYCFQRPECQGNIFSLDFDE